VRRQAQIEREAQQRRREDLQREIDERKAKIARDKRITSIVKARSVRRHEGQVMRVVSELKEESRIRSA
jgi:hypothetical protein